MTSPAPRSSERPDAPTRSRKRRAAVSHPLTYCTIAHENKALEIHESRYQRRVVACFDIPRLWYALEHLRKLFRRNREDSGDSTERTVFPSGPAAAFVLMCSLYVWKLSAPCAAE